MASEKRAQQPSGRERREYYRITVTLPICIQFQTDETDVALIEQSVNISGGGIGVTVTEIYQPNDVLTITLLLPDQVKFKALIEVLRIDPIPYPGGAYRLHARFIRMTRQGQELLIRHILQFQREHLAKHYSV